VRTIIATLAGLTVLAAVSAQAAPLAAAKASPAEAATPPIELVRQGWAGHRGHWRDRWGYWHGGRCYPN
jgi:hypothetical protein